MKKNYRWKLSFKRRYPNGRIVTETVWGPDADSCRKSFAVKYAEYTARGLVVFDASTISPENRRVDLFLGYFKTLEGHIYQIVMIWEYQYTASANAPV